MIVDGRKTYGTAKIEFGYGRVTRPNMEYASHALDFRDAACEVYSDSEGCTVIPSRLLLNLAHHGQYFH